MDVDEPKKNWPKTWPGALARVAELAAESWPKALRLSLVGLVVIAPLVATWWFR
jgi:hypothetical protein